MPRFTSGIAVVKGDGKANRARDDSGPSTLQGKYKKTFMSTLEIAPTFH